MALTEVDLATLQDGFAGQVLLPDHPGYDEARTLFNAMIDRRPAVIAQCRTAEDVAAALGVARARGLEVAVRGGGHGVAGSALVEGGLVIDLRHMDTVTVDPEARTATVGGGATMHDLDRATEPYGLATTGGRVSTTGVAGLTLGGGNGWLDRKYGLVCDNLLSVDLVTVDGSLVHADEAEHPELFWALHGGGGNFGVATSFTFRLHPLTEVTAAKLLWAPDAAPEVVRTFRDFMAGAPEEVGGACLFLTAPEAAIVPPHLTDRRALAVVVMYAGTGPEARDALAPVLGLGHEGGIVLDVPYADFQCMNEDPPGYRNHWSADHLDDLPDAAVERCCTHAAEMLVPSPSALAMVPQGGAVTRLGSGWPLLPWRSAPWQVLRFAMWSDPRDDRRAVAWARRLSTDLEPWASGDIYLNWTADQGPDRLLAGLGAASLTRLAAVKARYDPDNVLRPHHNIRPA